MSVQSEIRNCVTLDFETEVILSRPQYPPKPVGLAIRYVSGKAHYMSWGHPTENNCSLEDAKRFLVNLWRTNASFLFFHAKFDLAVAYEVLGLPILPWERIHDAMFLAFLADPHSKNLGLKPLAEDLLDWPPEEQDFLAQYVWDNRRRLVDQYGGKITKAKSGPNSAAAWISKCPADIVEPYAIGDVDRTFALFEHLYPLIAEFGMCEAYDRERRILPIFMENERDGINVDLDALARDVPVLRESLMRADEALRGMLGAPGLNINADAQLAEALTDAEVIDNDDWVLTPSGQKSVSKDNLEFEMFLDPGIGHLYFYRNRLTTALSTFLEPWLFQADQRNGVISTNWNQTRGGGGGTRTGRPSTSNPNFLNIPKEFNQTYDMAPGNEWGLEPLPFVRKYILPDPGHVFIHRDYDGQEMRIFAHYEQGDLLEAYLDDPDLDPHEWIRDEIYELVGLDLERTPVKIMNFQALYGGGIPAAAKALGCSMTKAREYKAFHDRALPGRKRLNKAIQEVMANGEPIHTWGGRLYFLETPRIVKGRQKSFLYKQINYLCQGSAADITKEAIIRWHDHPKREARFLLAVYDDINISAWQDIAREQMAILKETMESVELDLEMRTTGKIGSRWSELEECD